MRPEPLWHDSGMGIGWQAGRKATGMQMSTAYNSDEQKSIHTDVDGLQELEATSGSAGSYLWLHSDDVTRAYKLTLQKGLLLRCVRVM